MKGLDLFGSSIQFRFQGKQSLQTIFGSSFSLLIVAIVGIRLAFIIAEVWERNSPTMLYSERQVSQPAAFEFSNKTATFAFGLQNPNTYAHYIDPRIYNVTVQRFKKTNVYNAETRMKEAVYETDYITPIPCTESMFEGNKNSDFFLSQTYTDLYCFSQEDSFMIEGDFSQDAFQQLSITIRGCVGSTCATDDEINALMKNGYFAIYFTDVLVDPENKANPFSQYARDNYWGVNSNYPKLVNFYYRNTYIESDFGWIYEDIQTSRYAQFSNADVSYLPLDSVDYDFSMILRFEKSKENLYKRKYKNVNSIISEIGGFAQTLLAVGFFLCTRLSQLELNKEIINRAFNFETMNDMHMMFPGNSSEKETQVLGRKSNELKLKQQQQQFSPKSEPPNQHYSGSAQNHNQLQQPSQNLNSSRIYNNNEYLSSGRQLTSPIASSHQGLINKPKKSVAFLPETVQEINIAQSTNLSPQVAISVTDSTVIQQVMPSTAKSSAFVNVVNTLTNSTVAATAGGNQNVLPVTNLAQSQSQSVALAPHKKHQLELSQIIRRATRFNAPSAAAAAAVATATATTGSDKEIDQANKLKQQQVQQQSQKSEQKEEEQVSENHFKQLMNRFTGSMTLNVWEYVKFFVWPFGKVKEKKQIIDYSIDKLYYHLDVLNVVKKLLEVDKLKRLIMDEDQLNLFECWPKPLIRSAEALGLSQDREAHCSPSDILYQDARSDVERTQLAYSSYQKITGKTYRQPLEQRLLELMDRKLVHLFEMNYNDSGELAQPTSKVEQQQQQQQQQNNQMMPRIEEVKRMSLVKPSQRSDSQFSERQSEAVDTQREIITDNQARTQNKMQVFEQNWEENSQTKRDEEDIDIDVLPQGEVPFEHQSNAVKITSFPNSFFK